MIYTPKIYDTELVTFELTQKPLKGGLSNCQLKIKASLQ